MRRLPPVAAVCACLPVPCIAGVFAGCGGDDEQAAGTRTVTTPIEKGIRIVGREYSFDPSNVVVTGGGQLKVTLDNRGSLAHNVKLERGGRDVGGSPTFQGGQVRAGTARVEPGRYELICTVGDHAELGMRGELVVRE